MTEAQTTKDQEIQIIRFRKFLKHAEAGAHPGASHGQKIVNAIAKAFDKIGDDVALLDSDTIEGACVMLRWMGGPWPSDACKESVFGRLRRAAGRRR